MDPYCIQEGEGQKRVHYGKSPYGKKGVGCFLRRVTEARIPNTNASSDWGQ